jgi:hypothetical protein
MLFMVIMCAVPVTASVAALQVNSKELWNSTPIDSSAKILKGDTVQVSVSKDEKWTDWYIEVDANGYSNTFGVSTRFPGANLFALVCCAGPQIDSSCSVIGTSGTVVFDKDAPLSCFANDNEYMYWNNKGSITATFSIM